LEYHKPVVANTPSEDKLTALRNYRRAKNLCFTCGEKFSRDHKCHSTVQLHVVQEMVEFLTHSPSSSMDINDGTDDMELMHLADIGPDDPIPEQSIVLHCTIQGKPVLFLLDSGSNNSIISAQISAQFSGQQKLSRPRRVKVAGGGILNRDSYIPHCAWKCGELEFQSSFKILPLQGYDGIVGMDWLSLHRHQFVDWNEKWIAFQIKGKWICLQGGDPTTSTCNMVQICLMQDSADIPALIPPEVQAILDQFSLVFTEPSGLPPGSVQCPILFLLLTGPDQFRFGHIA
jgi:hypothetical protein